MRHNQRNLFLILVILVLLTASAFSRAGAWQQAGPTPSPKADSTVPVPVAVTERGKSETAPAKAQEISEGQFGNFGFPVISNKGEIAFLGRFVAPAPQRAGQAIFIRAADGTWRMLREKEKTLDHDWVMTGFNNPAINDNGDLTFLGNFADPEAALQSVSTQSEQGVPVDGSKPKFNAGIFYQTAAGIKNMVQLGDDVPRMPSKFTGFSNPSANTKGTLAFIGTYGDPDGRGLFMIEGGKLTLVVRSGQKIAQNDESVFSEHYYPSRLNERGEIAWFSRIGGSSGSGIFVKRASGVEAIALQDRPSPIKDAKYIGFGQIPPSINDKGVVAFVGFYGGVGDVAGRALFIKDVNGPAKVVAQSGDNIAGTTYNFTSFDKPVINNRGEIVFIGSYGGRTRGIFLKTDNGIEPVALAEEKVPGGTKEDVFNNFTPPMLNDRGEVVFYAQLKNSNVGIFIKDAKGLRQLVMRGDKMPIK